MKKPKAAGNEPANGDAVVAGIVDLEDRIFRLTNACIPRSFRMEKWEAALASERLELERMLSRYKSGALGHAPALGYLQSAEQRVASAKKPGY